MSLSPVESSLTSTHFLPDRINHFLLWATVFIFLFTFLTFFFFLFGNYMFTCSSFRSPSMSAHLVVSSVLAYSLALSRCSLNGGDNKLRGRHWLIYEKP